MGLSLYELDNRMTRVIESGFAVDYDTGEVFDSTDLDELDALVADKLEGCGEWIKNQAAMADAIRAEEKSLAERRKAIENRIEKVKAYVAHVVAKQPNRRFETPRVSLSLRKSSHLEIDDGAPIPEDYMTIKHMYQPDKIAIKQAIKAGETITGCRIVSEEKLQVK